jgi:dihydrofolate reductase
VTLPVVLVAAVARNGIIGVDNGLPWRMRSDLKHFRATTMGKPLVMGRKTYESIGRPLPGRETVVVSRNRSFAAEGVHVVDGLEAALSLADMIGSRMGADAIIIAGGATLYAETIGTADRLVITELDLEAEGDAAFPPIDAVDWREASRQPYPRGEGDDASYTVVVYERTRQDEPGSPAIEP